MPEVEHEQMFVVRIAAFGDPEKERDRLMLRLARALHHDVKPGCSIAAVEPTHGLLANRAFRMQQDASWRTLDPKGDDQGHHGPEHPVPLIDPVKPVDGRIASRANGLLAETE